MELLVIASRGYAVMRHLNIRVATSRRDATRCDPSRATLPALWLCFSYDSKNCPTGVIMFLLGLGCLLVRKQFSRLTSRLYDSFSVNFNNASETSAACWKFYNEWISIRQGFILIHFKVHCFPVIRDFTCTYFLGFVLNSYRIRENIISYETFHMI